MRLPHEKRNAKWSQISEKYIIFALLMANYKIGVLFVLICFFVVFSFFKKCSVVDLNQVLGRQDVV